MLDPYTQGRLLYSDSNCVIAVSLRCHRRATTDAMGAVELIWDKQQLPECFRVWQQYGITETEELVYLALPGCIWITAQTSPTPPHRVLSTLQTQPRRGKAELHLSSHEVSNAGTSSRYISALALTRLLKQDNNSNKLAFIGLSQPISGPPHLGGSPRIYFFTFKLSTL